MKLRLVAAAVALTLAAASSAFAQGKSPEHKKASPPSRSQLPSPAISPSSSGTGTPFAWIDDASLITPGTAMIAVSVLRWQGTDVSEVDAPVIDAAIGLGRRAQLTAMVPRVVGSVDTSGAVGGVGTSYFSAKIVAAESADSRTRLAIAPTIELLGDGVLQSAGTGESRAHFGLPVSAQVAAGPARVYASAGYFTRGIWFAGGGVGARAGDRTFVSVGYSRSWRRDDSGLDTPLADRARNEVTGALSYALTPSVGLFGSIGQTFNTIDENGAGTTVGGGISLFFQAK